MCVCVCVCARTCACVDHCVFVRVRLIHALCSTTYSGNNVSDVVVVRRKRSDSGPPLSLIHPSQRATRTAWPTVHPTKMYVFVIAQQTVWPGNERTNVLVLENVPQDLAVATGDHVGREAKEDRALRRHTHTHTHAHTQQQHQHQQGTHECINESEWMDGMDG